MRIGVPSEIKVDEYRVAVSPAGVRELVDAGHEVVGQSGAGLGSAISDEAYEKQGETILPDAGAVFADAEMIVKVKEPQAVDDSMLGRGICSSPTCTSPPTPSSRTASRRPAPPASPTSPKTPR